MSYIAYATGDKPLEPNPKKLMGDKKPPLHLLPLAGMIHQSLAHLDGDLKYGFENWNEKPVEKLTYIGAAIRHAFLYKYGETHTRDTHVHNLGAVMACCAILLDAELNGNLIDNTKHSKATCDLMHHAEAIVTKLNEMQKEREAAKAEQARKDQSWADAANEPDSLLCYSDQELAERFDRLKADALRPIIDDAGGDAPAEPEFVRCVECTDYACAKYQVCCHPKKFTTCGACDSPSGCARNGVCAR